MNTKHNSANMNKVSKKVQVMLDHVTFASVRQLSKLNHRTVSAWIRSVILERIKEEKDKAIA